MRRNILRALCLCMALLMMGCFASAEGDDGVIPKEYIIAEADCSALPQALSEGAEADIDAWWAAVEARQSSAVAHPEALNQFTERSARLLLGPESDKNSVYSPLSLWLELDLIAAIAAGDSRGQVLEALGEDSIEALTEQTTSLWHTQYWEDADSACVPGVALWLNQGVDVTAAEALRKERIASIYKGDMRDPGFNGALQQWLNRMTRGMLSEAVSSLRFEDDAQISATSTLYCRDRWANPFPKEDTAPAVFHAPDGDVEVDFMNLRRSDAVYYGPGFAACARNLMGAGRVVFVLPDAGTSPGDILGGPEVFQLLQRLDAWENQEEAMVTFSMPRLDLDSELALRNSLEQMGIGNIFSEEKADFSGALTSDVPVHMSSILQIARIKMDEEGLEAAAVTVSDVVGALLMPEKEVDFTLDRPFLFALLGAKDVPLFIGVVNHP